MKYYPFLDLALANKPMMEELKEAACSVIESGRYINGEQCRLLEQEIAQLCQVKHCVAVSNGLDALRLIIRAYKELGVLHNDEKIIVPANTYVASVLAVSDNGLNATLCDIRNDTMNLDSHGIAQRKRMTTAATNETEIAVVIVERLVAEETHGNESLTLVLVNLSINTIFCHTANLGIELLAKLVGHELHLLVLDTCTLGCCSQLLHAAAVLT